MCACVLLAVLEAEDIDLYLRPLRRLICSFEEKSFFQVESLLPPLFHTLCLIWSQSHYYCSPARMVVLLQEFCNLLIDKVCVCVFVCLFCAWSILLWSHCSPIVL